MKPPQTVCGHLEMGDLLVLNGLIRTLAADRPLRWIVGLNYAEAAIRMISNAPVKIVGVRDYQEAKQLLLQDRSAIRLGIFKHGFDETRWDEEFYRQANVPFAHRWTHSKFSEPLPRAKEVGVLIHEDLPRSYLIPTVEGLRITQRACVFDWLPEILGAKELHFIDSCFLNLAESLYAQGQLQQTRLFFHRYSKVYPGPARWPTLRAPWTVLDQPLNATRPPCV